MINRRVALAAFAVTTYVASIVLANVLTDRYGLVPVGFGLVVTAGTYAAGFALLARDLVHRTAGLTAAVLAVLAGSLLSWMLASPGLALASGLAFLCSEAVDLVIYAETFRRIGFVPAVLLSNLASAPVDTFLFLQLAGFPITTETVVGQLVAKLLWSTLLPLLLYIGTTHALSRQPSDSSDPLRDE